MEVLVEAVAVQDLLELEVAAVVPAASEEQDHLQVVDHHPVVLGYNIHNL
jgi:hypothetical protein